MTGEHVKSAEQPKRITITTPTFRAIHQKGRDAAKAGQPRKAPYIALAQTEKLRLAWLQGWDDESKKRVGA